MTSSAHKGAGALSLSGCPFCGRHPHQGPTKLEHCQLHGEPFQRHRIWCPAGCADITAPEKDGAVKRWNTRVPLVGVEAGEEGKDGLPLPAASGAASGWMAIDSYLIERIVELARGAANAEEAEQEIAALLDIPPSVDGLDAGEKDRLPRRVAGAAEQEVERLRAALKPFAGDTMPSLRRTKIAFDRTDLRRSMSPMEIAMLAARKALEGKANG